MMQLHKGRLSVEGSAQKVSSPGYFYRKALTTNEAVILCLTTNYYISCTHGQSASDHTVTLNTDKKMRVQSRDRWSGEDMASYKLTICITDEF